MMTFRDVHVLGSPHSEVVFAAYIEMFRRRPAFATDMLRDAELPTREYVELVLAGVERETDMSVVQTVPSRRRKLAPALSSPPKQ